jgi:hypothetical protein
MVVRYTRSVKFEDSLKVFESDDTIISLAMRRMDIICS